MKNEHWHADCNVNTQAEFYTCLDHDVELCKCGWEKGWHYGVHASLQDTKIPTAYGNLLNRLVGLNHKYDWDNGGDEEPPRELVEEKQALIDSYFNKRE